MESPHDFSKRNPTFSFSLLSAFVFLCFRLRVFLSAITSRLLHQSEHRECSSRMVVSVHQDDSRNGGFGLVLWSVLSSARAGTRKYGDG